MLDARVGHRAIGRLEHVPVEGDQVGAPALHDRSAVVVAVHVRRADGGGKRMTVAASGGYSHWSRDGRQIFTAEQDPPVMVARDFESDGSIGVPRRLFDFPYNADWDVAPDGRFLVVSEAEAPTLVSDTVPAPSVPAWARLRPLLSDSAYRAALIGSAAGFYVTGGLQTLIPGFWVDILARDRGAVGLPFTVLSLASLIVIWHAGSVSDRLGRKVAA